MDCLRLSQWLGRHEGIVLVCCGEEATFTNGALVWLTRKSAVILESPELTHRELLHAVLRAGTGTSFLDLERHLQHASRLRGVPARVVTAFLAAPGNLFRLADLARALCRSRESTRALARRLGFKRVAHLLTALRAEAWLWCARQGLNRKWFEAYLGIGHRSDFARACDRAQVERPWHRQPLRPSGS